MKIYIAGPVIGIPKFNRPAFNFEAMRLSSEGHVVLMHIRNRFKELDRVFGKNLLVMQAAIIDWRTTEDAKNGMAWIFNTLLCPGELPSEDEKDAQAYFDREYAPLDKELMELQVVTHIC